jgi:membrane-associated phospholipid phosphatase
MIVDYPVFVAAIRIRLAPAFFWVLSLTASSAAQSSLLDPAAPAVPATSACRPADSAQRQVSWKRLAPNIWQDQKRVWLSPPSLVHDKHWLPTAGVVLGTAALVALDPHDAPYFRRTHAFTDFNRALSFDNTIIGMAAVPTTAYLAGLVRHDSYSQQTVELAAEALVDAGIPALVIRDIGRRVPPGSIPPNRNFDDSWFHSHRGPFYLGPGGFPSGHALAAFSIATVFAGRYRRHRWVAWTAYGLAGLVGFSRITLQAHFPSDVFVGAVLGYTISHYIVLRSR